VELSTDSAERAVAGQRSEGGQQLIASTTARTAARGIKQKIEEHSGGARCSTPTAYGREHGARSSLEARAILGGTRRSRRAAGWRRGCRVDNRIAVSP